MKRATVVASEPLGADFRLVTLEGPDLQGVDWIPGQKLQIAMGSAFVARTYTPITWNSSAGQTRILGFAHGDGPGSAWVRSVQLGDECDLFGPRRSLDLGHLGGPLAILGDETSIGLAYALIHQGWSRPVSCHFEVEEAEISGQIVTKLGIDATTTLFERRANDEHVADMEDSLAARIQANARFVLTGRAGTIQRLRQSLKLRAVPAAHVISKAYWAPGKVGLD